MSRLSVGYAGAEKEVGMVQIGVLTRRRRPTQPVVLPSVCPQCGGPGYLEHINLTRETTTQSCSQCEILWESEID